MTIVVFLGGIGLDWELSQHTCIHMTVDNISLFHCHGTKSHHFHCYKNERKIVPFSVNRESTIKINTEQYIMNLLYTHSHRQTRKFSLGYTEPLCNQAIFSSSNTLFWWEIFGEKERKYLKESDISQKSSFVCFNKWETFLTFAGDEMRLWFDCTWQTYKIYRYLSKLFNSLIT